MNCRRKLLSVCCRHVRKVKVEMGWAKLKQWRYVEKTRPPYWERLWNTDRTNAANVEDGCNWSDLSRSVIIHQDTTSTTLYIARLETLKSASASFDNVRQWSAMFGNVRQWSAMIGYDRLCSRCTSYFIHSHPSLQPLPVVRRLPFPVRWLLYRMFSIGSKVIW